MKISLQFLFILLFCQPTFAQYSIKGKVIHNQNEPLEFVNILLLAPSDSSLVKGTISDAAGQFVLSNLTPGDYLLQTQFLSYRTRTQSLTIVDQQPLLQLEDIHLYPDDTSLDQVTVTAKRPLYEQKIDRTVVNVRNSVTSAGSNVLEILGRSPGIRVDEISGSISLNGVDGVIIQINGKRNRMNGIALLQYLRSMPADNIEKIELITTPPASYDAEGAAGIINIVPVNDEREGTYGSVNIYSGYGVRPKWGGSTSLNWRKGKVNVFGNFSADSDLLREDTEIQSTIQNQTGILRTDAYSRRPAYRGSYNGRLGMDYNLSPKTSIGVLFSGFRNEWTLDATTTTTTLLNDALVQKSVLKSQEENNWNHLMGNINFKHEFANKLTWTIDYDYLTYENENPAFYQESIENNEGVVVDETEFESRKENPIYFHVFKTDFSRQVNEKLQVEFGVKGTISNFANDNFLGDVINEKLILRPMFSNNVMMDENIGALYFSTGYQLSEKTSIKGGLRYEITDVLLTDGPSTLVNRTYNRLFPTFFFSHQFNDENNVRLTYSERIQRPNIDVLAPAFFFLTPNTLMTGNPTIQPTISRSLTLSYQFKTLNISINASDDDNPLSYGQIDIIEDENLTLTRPEVIEDEKMVYMGASLSLQPTKWWEQQYETWTGYNYNETAFDEKTVTTGGFFWGIYSSQNIQLSKDLSFQISGRLQSRFEYGISSIPMRGSFDLGLQKKLPGGHQLTVSWNDVLNLGSFWENNIVQPELNRVFRQVYDFEGSVFRIAYSWNFGNQKAQRQRQHNGASSDERGRVN